MAQVSWDDVQQYINWLNARKDGYHYRLPTEAEWEYSARAGSAKAQYGNFNEIAWNSQNSGNRTHEVGQKLPNAWGLYDTLGNAWEWVQDSYQPGYSIGMQIDPSGPTAELPKRVARGGGYDEGSDVLRASFRGTSTQGSRGFNGFRLVRVAIPQSSPQQ